MTTVTMHEAAPARPPSGDGHGSRGKGAVAVAATLLLPGLGQILAGARRRGGRSLEPMNRE